MAGTLVERALFVCKLVLTVAGRALPALGRAPRTRPRPNAKDDAQVEDLIEALQTGDIDALRRRGPGLAHGCNSLGTPWFFITLESGSLAAVEWFLGQGASPTATDPSGRLPLETLIQRAAFADEFDDHLSDCPAMAKALIAAGADPEARTLQGERLSDMARKAGLDLPPT